MVNHAYFSWDSSGSLSKFWARNARRRTTHVADLVVPPSAEHGPPTRPRNLRTPRQVHCSGLPRAAHVMHHARCTMHHAYSIAHRTPPCLMPHAPAAATYMAYLDLYIFPISCSLFPDSPPLLILLLFPLSHFFFPPLFLTFSQITQSCPSLPSVGPVECYSTPSYSYLQNTSTGVEIKTSNKAKTSTILLPQPYAPEHAQGSGDEAFPSFSPAHNINIPNQHSGFGLSLAFSQGHKLDDEKTALQRLQPAQPHAFAPGQNLLFPPATSSQILAYSQEHASGTVAQGHSQNTAQTAQNPGQILQNPGQTSLPGQNIPNLTHPSVSQSLLSLVQSLLNVNPESYPMQGVQGVQGFLAPVPHEQPQMAGNPVSNSYLPYLYDLQLVPPHLAQYKPYDYYLGPQVAGISASVSGPSSSAASNTTGGFSGVSSNPSSYSLFQQKNLSSVPPNMASAVYDNSYMPVYSLAPPQQPQPQVQSQNQAYSAFQQPTYPYRQSASFSGYPHPQNSVGLSEAGRNRCPVCHKVFKRPLSLQIHFYIHTGVKMFKCEWEGCGRMFNVKLNMKRHYRLHVKREKERQGYKDDG